MIIFIFFFFQAEDGIRDLYVTGVQTCALPILQQRWLRRGSVLRQCQWHIRARRLGGPKRRSEERRVGKECRSRWSPDHYKKKRHSNHLLAEPCSVKWSADTRKNERLL